MHIELLTDTKMYIVEIDDEYKIVVDFFRMDRQNTPRYKITLLRHNKALLYYNWSTHNVKEGLIENTNKVIERYNKKYRTHYPQICEELNFFE